MARFTIQHVQLTDISTVNLLVDLPPLSFKASSFDTDPASYFHTKVESVSYNLSFHYEILDTHHKENAEDEDKIR